MKIGVCLKQVPATDTRIKLNKDASSGIDTDGVKWEINPYDEFALEEALRLKDADSKHQVVIFTLGSADSEAKIREGLARGADSAVRVDDPALAGSDALGVARALAAAIRAEGVELLFCGKQAVDDDNSQVPAMIAEFLGWSQVSDIAKLELSGGVAKAWRNAGSGARDVVEVPLPVVLTADKELNSPRYAALRGIMMAKKKTISVKSLAALGVDAGLVGAAGAVVTESGWGLPPQRAAVHMISGEGASAARELVRLLREEAKVL